MRVLWDPSFHGSGLIYIGCEDWVTHHLGLRIIVFTTIPFLVIWFSLIALIWVGHHSLHLLASLIRFPSSLFILVTPYLSLSYIDTCLWFISFSHIHHILHWQPDHFSFLLYFIIDTSIVCYLVHWLTRLFFTLHLIHEGIGFDLGYLSLVSFHFFHSITLSVHYGPCHKTTLRPWD